MSTIVSYPRLSRSLDGGEALPIFQDGQQRQVSAYDIAVLAPSIAETAGQQLTGEGPPAADLGSLGQMYYDRRGGITTTLYGPKTSMGWGEGQPLKGDPGGNVLAVGFFAELGTLSIPMGTDLIQTSGNTQPGWGSALYAIDPDQADQTATAWRGRSMNGRWFRLVPDQGITLAMFGALADNTTDTTAAWAAAFAYGVFPLTVEPGAAPYRIYTRNALGIQVPAKATIWATGAEVQLDSADQPEAFRFGFNLDGTQDFHWLGGKISCKALVSGCSFGGGASCGRIRLEGITDCTRGPVFTATPIASGIGVAIAIVNAPAGTFTVPGHGLTTGELISLYRADQNNNLYNFLETHRDYYVIVVDADTIQVAGTRTLALQGTRVGFNARLGSPPTHLRKGLVTSKSLEIVDYRCENTSNGPHVFGMWERVLIKNLTGYTNSVQLFQFERPGGGVWLTWGYVFVSIVDDVDCEASALGGVEWSHCHEIHAKRIRVRNPNRLIDGTLMGYKPEAPDEATAYAGISIGAMTTVATFEDCYVEGAPVLPATGPRSKWAHGTETAGIRLFQPSGLVTFLRCGGVGNAKSDLDIAQTAGDGYTRGLKAQDRIIIRESQFQSALPITTTDPNDLPTIDADATADPFGRLFGGSPASLALPGWNLVGPDGAVVDWLKLGPNVSVDTASKKYGYGSVSYRGGDRFTNTGINLPSSFRVGNWVHVYVLMAINSSHTAQVPNFFACWDDEVDKGIFYSFKNIGVGDLILDTYMVAHAILPSSRTTTGLRLYPHFAQDCPPVADPDWYYKLEGMWVWSTPNPFSAPGIDLSQPIVTNGAPTLGNHFQGEKFMCAAPATGGSIGYVCTVAGAPGTWGSFGAEATQIYQEGTFVPVLYGSITAGTRTGGSAAGRYTRKGDTATIDLTISQTSHTGTGEMRIAFNLPFTLQGDRNYPTTITCAGLVTNPGTTLQAFVPQGQAYVALVNLTNSGDRAAIPFDNNTGALADLTISFEAHIYVPGRV
ncbi:hypothetical protein [Sphingomonas bacterium]|uniref:hypothetical protein n=1 Tax=Sphingomonas bacterium TaxID=1895847 RepID=UPI00157536B1|nr:hypothetical protein [Sphingomonas bacterium]